jgi:hypothetical protein
MDPLIAEAVQQGMDGLAEMAPCHHFAEQALNILRYLVQEWGMEIDTVDGPVMDTEDYEKFVKPYASTLNFFADSKLAKNLILKRSTDEVTFERVSPQG